jgi:hypothetical protein
MGGGGSQILKKRGLIVKRKAKKGELKNKYNYVKNIEVYKINTENAYVQNILKDLKEVK